jgi:hypothetical protein
VKITHVVNRKENVNKCGKMYYSRVFTGLYEDNNSSFLSSISAYYFTRQDDSNNSTISLQ